MSSVHRVGLSVILFENLVNDYGFVIGRADKRYTLWRYERTNENDVTRMNIQFVQVLSPDREKVARRFPNVYVCEELRGEHKISITKSNSTSNSKPASAPKTIWDFEEIPFGSLKGTKFSDICDKSLCRMINNAIEYGNGFKWTDAWGEEFDFEEIIVHKLNECGCRSVAGKWYTSEQLEKQSLWMYLANTNADPDKQAEYDAMCESFECIKLLGKWFSCTPQTDQKEWQTVGRDVLAKAEMGLPFSFVAPYNGHSFFFGVHVTFREEDKGITSTYYGTTRFLKVTNKKGVKVNKRPKGKTIEVLEYEVKTDELGNAFIIVNKFNIL